MEQHPLSFKVCHNICVIIASLCLQVKVKAARGFLAKGNKVKLTMTFSGREMRFKDQGKELMLVSAVCNTQLTTSIFVALTAV
jgi:translation initiation factor IF-3